MRRALEIPSKITPEGDDAYFEELTKAIFRAGFSWPVVREKWDGFVKSFEQFRLDRVWHGWVFSPHKAAGRNSITLYALKTSGTGWV